MDPLDDGVRMHPIVVLALAKICSTMGRHGAMPHRVTCLTLLTRLILLTRLTLQPQCTQDRPV
jgi:hypothetical protein